MKNSRFPHSFHWLCFGITLVSIAPFLTAQVISTVAGGAVGDGGPATAAALDFPRYMARDASGNLFISDSQHNRIRKVTASGLITTVAGTGIAGYAGDGGPAAAALLSLPAGIAFDSGNLFVADQANHVIRKINSSGIITTIAGNGTAGFSGDGGPAAAATLKQPLGLTFDGAGNLYFADVGNSVIRRIDTSGIITTVAGNGTVGFSGDGGPATTASLNVPRSVLSDAVGNLLIADTPNHRVRKVDVFGVITTIAGNGLAGFSGDGGPATSARIGNPRGLAFDSDGGLLISNAGRSRIRKVNPSGVITTVAGSVFGFDGDGNSALASRFQAQTDLLLDGAAGLLIADSGNGRIRRLNPSGTVKTVAGGLVGDGNPATQAALNTPQSLAFDSAGNMYIADTFNFRVRKVGASGVISTIAGTGISGSTGDGGAATLARLFVPFGIVVDSAGNVYFGDHDAFIRKVDSSSGIITTVAGNELGSAGDGPATSVRLQLPAPMLFDASGNLFFNDVESCRVRKLDTAGIITTVAGNGICGFAGDGGSATSASLNGPFGLAMDGTGSFYISELFGHRIRKVAPSGLIQTIAGNGTCGFSGDGGPALTAQLCAPSGLGLDGVGNLYIAESNNSRIRRIDAGGIITTVAGSNVFGFRGDGGAASSAGLGVPFGLALDSLGNVYFTDDFIFRVRKITIDSGQAVEVLVQTLESLSLPQGVSANLRATLNAARDALQRGNRTAARQQLRAFITQVNARRGRGLTDQQADFLIEAANAVIATI